LPQRGTKIQKDYSDSLIPEKEPRFLTAYYRLLNAYPARPVTGSLILIIGVVL
jgi:hypothetical protein